MSRPHVLTDNHSTQHHDTAPREMRGIQAGAIVLAAVVVTNLGNYAFHLFAAQRLGPADYGSVVSLLALAALIGLPLAGVQLAVARHTSSYAARSAHATIAGVFTRGLVAATVAGSALTLLLLASVPLLTRLLDIQHTFGVVLTALLTMTAVWTPVVWGLTQGLQRFGLLAVSMSAGTALRLALLVGLITQGWRVAGAMVATLLGALFSLLICMWPLRVYIDLRAPRLPNIDLAARRVLPIVGGLLALTSLTSIDVIVAKTAFDDHTAGIYGGASVIGRVVLYVPAAIAMVLLPKVSSRFETNRETTSIVGASIAVTTILCLLVTVTYALFPALISTTALGDDFYEAGPLLWRFGIAMTGYAVLNLLLVYHVGLGSTAMTWLLLCGAGVELVGYALFHESPTELILVSMVTALALIVVHELTIASAGRMTFEWLSGTTRLVRRRMTAT